MGVKVTVKDSSGWFITEDKELAFPVKDKDGQPIDVKTWAAKYVLMKNPKATEYLIEKTTGPGNGIRVEAGPEGTDNVYVVDITEADMVGLRAGVELYQELKRTDNDNAGVLAYGPVTLGLSGID